MRTLGYRVTDLKDKDISHKYREISSVRLYFLLSLFMFLFVVALILLTYISDFSNFSENLFTLFCFLLFLFFFHKMYKNIKYLKYFYRLDLCHKTTEIIIVIVLFLMNFVMFFGNTVFLFSAAGMKEYNRNIFSQNIFYMQKHISSLVGCLDSSSISEEKFAENLFNEICNVKKAYYITIDDVNASMFSKHEINRYNLKRYIKRPTVRGEDGMIYSLVKYQEGCRYIDTEKPYSSDCVLEIDLNGFKDPNNEKTDRLIFVISGNELIPSDISKKLMKKRKKNK